MKSDVISISHGRNGQRGSRLMRHFFTSVGLGLFFSGMSDAVARDDRFVCAGTAIEISNSDQVGDPFFRLSLKREKRRLRINYTAEREFLFVRCERRGETYVLLVNHFCGGSGCAGENFGIVDLRTLSVLLHPDQSFVGNRDRASAILGHTVKPFSCNAPSSSSHGWQRNGEYCYVSPLNLG
jgi:hypothetical protein